MALDKARLVAHIKAKAKHPHLLIHAVLTGLATAIERGDFDEETIKKNTERSKNDGTSVV